MVSPAMKLEDTPMWKERQGSPAFNTLSGARTFCGHDERASVPPGQGALSYLPITMTWKLSGSTGGRDAFWPSLAAGAGPYSAASMEMRGVVGAKIRRAH